jgi:hypothetical protein
VTPSARSSDSFHAVSGKVLNEELVELEFGVGTGAGFRIG